jgi:hypothetical protein
LQYDLFINIVVLPIYCHIVPIPDKDAQMEKTSSSLANSEHANHNKLVASDQKVTFVAVFLGLVASIGGFM